MLETETEAEDKILASRL